MRDQTAVQATSLRRRVSGHIQRAMMLAVIAGCTTGETDGPSADNGAPPPAEAAGASQAPQRYQLADLDVGLGDYLPPLDEGRVEIAPPAKWRVGSRQQKLVVWFHRYDDPKLLPQIRVTAEGAPAAAPGATPENVREFADWLAGHVQQQLGEKETLVEPVTPVVLGDNAFGYYVRKGKYRGAAAQRHILTTSHQGRMYAMSLIAFTEQVPENRDAVFAAGAGMKFRGGGGASDAGSGEVPGESHAP